MAASYPGLNPAQAEAVLHTEGPLLVLAGAGSGKTRVITHRIARIISLGVPASAICALTFTNKAAAEMAERVQKVMSDQGKPGGAKGITVSTFHSFGLQVLQREARSLGGAFTIFDQGDQVSLVKELLAQANVAKNYDAMAVCARISAAKNASMTAEQLQERTGDDYDEITKIVFPRYQAALRNFRAYDFDDLVGEVARILKERDDVRERWQQRFRYLLVDEYQDTNGAQLELLRSLTGAHRNVCVVGDDDQSIYAWRGADVRNILDFEEHFPGAKVVKLEENYRSHRPILDVANAVISKRTDAKHKKTLFTQRDGGAPVRMFVAATPDEEAEFVGDQIADLRRAEGVPGREIAVLYRSNGQAKLIEEALRERGVKYRMIGGQQFFERKEVKDVLAFLKLTLNRSDDISLRRIINYPARGIGEASVQQLSLHAAAHGWTLWQAVERVDAIDGISNAAREGCKELERVMGVLQTRLMVERASPADTARELCQIIGMRKEIDLSSTSSGMSARRWANVDGFLQMLKRREVRQTESGTQESDRDFAQFLHRLTLQLSGEEEETTEHVTLSTLHGSKGLEFGHVFLLGCEEGLMPHTRTTETKATDAPMAAGVDPIEEERRLFYVGVTRAKERLILSRCSHRVVKGTPVPRTPSRFLSDIPEEMLHPVIHIKEALTQDLFASGAAGLLSALLGEGGS